MRWRGVHHVEFAVLDYDDSVARFPTFHSYIGIQPARTGEELRHTDQAVGINHVALWARSRAEVDRFYREFLTRRGIRVTDEPREYPHFALKKIASAHPDWTNSVPRLARQAVRTLPSRSADNGPPSMRGLA